jgi:acyl CoA:acetate/3-ketoacid CoA transferase alpha subunit
MNDRCGPPLEVQSEGTGEALPKIDLEEHRQWVLEKKSRVLESKLTSVKEAVTKFVNDNSYIVLGGFGHVRSPMTAVYELIRQGKRGLVVNAHPGCHDIDLLAAAGCIRKVDRAYGGGHEVRGLSPAFRRAVEAGEIEVVEWSNAALAWRFKAAAMGLPFLPCRVMIGTDTFRHSAAKIVSCPFTGVKICLVPACYPDVAFIHVHRCDAHGNAQIDGTTVEDVDIARASRRVVLTTEEIVPTDRLRETPWRTTIPHYLVDAVVEIPWGAHPTNMPYLYYFDEEHITEWLRKARTEEGARDFLDKYVRGLRDFDSYLELVGGVRKLTYLKKLEQYQATLETPWTEE